MTRLAGWRSDIGTNQKGGRKKQTPTFLGGQHPKKETTGRELGKSDLGQNGQHQC